MYNYFFYFLFELILFIILFEPALIFIVSYLNPYRLDDIPLYDFWREMLGPVKYVAKNVFKPIDGETYILALFILLAMIMFQKITTPYWIAKGDRDGFLEEAFMISKALLLTHAMIRPMFFASTILTSQHKKCFLSKRFDRIISISDIVKYCFLRAPIGGGCNDLLFSGHATVTVFVCLTFARHRGGWITKALWISAVFTCLLMIAEGHHYSVDVIVSWVVSTASWHIQVAP